ncbi:hypothetical protein YB2330_005382 [Saitoella coloradoensis]|uniref:NADH dehydrogenase, alpha subcomplex, subunit 2 n=1 Tax=Saitoella complicata (strain BCRC 22490 / CBS 7301 / JCM 7358 / NBRC 10748 / NRRL Y-17804) TaxID=698492 RepID=UPI000867F7F2|nr:NADH dehydrogenase, alpha subcomplex, subunit 2 [Saitoella complicata NRRL Y-17804]ODQ56164.1 NADH dehydrogenase, alpha subcomplex, subunit 2 [Saitoella complicata NRRL Y-17804]
MSAKYAFSQAIKEVRFHFCQTSETSNGVREFLQKSYPVMKKHNPTTPILIREAFGVPAKMYVRYEMGREEKKSLDGLGKANVEKEVSAVLKA